MGEVTGAVIATALVLAAVFVPVAFFPGTTGRLYQQFALTIAVSMVISAFNALTLTPALAALLLQKVEKPKGLFFRGVNRVIDGGTNDARADAAGPDSRARARGDRVRRAARGHVLGREPRCRPGSCRTRIRATSSSSCRRRRARRSSTR